MMLVPPVAAVFGTLVPAFIMNVTIIRGDAITIGKLPSGETGTYGVIKDGAWGSYTDFGEVTGKVLHMADSVWAYPGGGGDFEMRALLSVEGGAESTEREYLEMRFDGYYDPTYLTAYRKIAAGDPDAKPIPYGVPKNGYRMTFRTGNPRWKALEEGLNAVMISYAPGPPGENFYYASYLGLRVVQQEQKFSLFDIPTKLLPKGYIRAAK